VVLEGVGIAEQWERPGKVVAVLGAMVVPQVLRVLMVLAEAGAAVVVALKMEVREAMAL
jgi:hypothetical protein